jgi:ubiquitin carboxyl-terminal hydrolase 4/11/15
MLAEEGSALPPPDVQLEMYHSVAKSDPITIGCTGYLLYSGWFNQWKRFVGYDDSLPQAIKVPPISNKNLLLPNGRVKPTLTEGHDFVLLSESLWRLFMLWYRGSPEIPVEVIAHPTSGSPIPLLNLWTFSINFQGKTQVIETHKYKTVGSLKAEICQLLAIDPVRTRIRDSWNNHYGKELPEDAFIFSLTLVDTQDLLVEVQDADGAWPQPAGSRLRGLPTRTSSSSTMGIATFGKIPGVGGRVGLFNLGNTCFFNSTVQSLAHTDLAWKQMTPSGRKLIGRNSIQTAKAWKSNFLRCNQENSNLGWRGRQ